MFPDVHPSKGSVPNMGIGLGCPAIIFDQMGSDQWKSTTRAQIDERQPTFKKGRRVGLLWPPPTSCSATLPSSAGALAWPSPDRDRARRPHVAREATPATPSLSEQRACAPRHHAPRRAPGTTTAPAAHPATAAPAQGGQEERARHLGAGGLAGPSSRGARDPAEREDHLRARPDDLEAHVQSHKSRQVVVPCGCVSCSARHAVYLRVGNPSQISVRFFLPVARCSVCHRAHRLNLPDVPDAAPAPAPPI